MEFKLLNLTSKEATNILPKRVAALTEEKSSFVFGVTENSDLLGVALMSVTPGRDFVINYIWASDTDLEVLEILFSGIEDFCRDNDATSISARFVDVPDRLIPLIKPLANAGFTPVYLQGRLLSYRLFDIKKTEHYKLLESKKLNKIKESFVSYEDLSKARKNDFYKKRRDFFSYEESRNYENYISSFVTDKENVKGGIVADVSSPEAIMVEDFFLEDSSVEKHLFLGLLGTLLDEINSRSSDDTAIIFKLNSEKICRNIISLFGNPSTDYHVFEFGKIL